MAERPRITLFCEDRDHEQFVRGLVGRLASEVGIRPLLEAASARGGHGRALTEFRLWQKSFLQVESGPTHLLVLVIDANCSTWRDVRRELEDAVDQTVVPRHVVGCPDPHVERWYIADPTAFDEVVGCAPGPDPGKCERHLYKHLVEEAVEAAGTPLLTGTADLAPDLVGTMNLYRASKNQPSLGRFVDDLRAAFRQLAGP